MTKKKWSALHDEVSYRRRPDPGIDDGKAPPHRVVGDLKDRDAVIVEVFAQPSGGRIHKVENLRATRHRFDADGRLNLEHYEMRLATVVENMTSCQRPKPPNPYVERLSQEQAALIRAQLYRSKHGRDSNGF